MLRFRGQQSLQRRISQRLTLLQSLFEHAGEYNKPGGKPCGADTPVRRF